jgi:two-component system, NtrC family, sensor histidine kinase GlrK
MMIFKRLTILKRLTIGYLTIMLIVMLMGSYVVIQLNELKKLTFEYEAKEGAIIKNSESLLSLLISQVGFEKKFIISEDRDFYNEFVKVRDQYLKKLAEYDPLISENNGYGDIQGIRETYNRYLSIFYDEVHFLEEKNFYSSKIYEEKKNACINTITHLFHEIIQKARINRDKKIHKSSIISEQVFRVVLITVLLVVGVGLLISYQNSKGINRPIALLKDQTKEIAKGKFEKIFGIDSPPEIKSLADDFNRMCERLKELDQMKVDFISHVSHELRTPLTVIREATSMLLDGTCGDSLDSQKNLLRITREASERLIASVNRILDLTRIEAKMMTYKFEICSLYDVIRRSVERIDPLLKRKKIQIDAMMPENLPRVRIDPCRIDEVFNNILGNALKFSSEDDRISIGVSVENDPHPCIQVAISDTGKGIPKESLEIIFDKFQRIESGKETIRGTGLGLSISKHIVDAHGGKIWAESVFGKGSTFFFTLPAA